jgi:hypothetical protein
LLPYDMCLIQLITNVDTPSNDNFRFRNQLLVSKLHTTYVRFSGVIKLWQLG